MGVLHLVINPRFPTWLDRLPTPIRGETSAGLRYLNEHGRAAVLPDVRHRIQTSRHFPDLSEVRVNLTVEGRPYAIRVLTCFVDQDRALLGCVGGDKEGYTTRTGRDWHDDYVPVADEVVDRYLKRKETP